MSEPDEAAITRLLAEHAIIKTGDFVTDLGKTTCLCGEQLLNSYAGGAPIEIVDWHRAHVAAVLAAHMADGLERIAIDIETAAAINESMFPNAPDYRSGLRTAAQMVRLIPDTEGETDE